MSAKKIRTIRDISPLYDETEIYQAVAHLLPGDLLPSQVYVADYCNGSIPAWTVQEREPCGTEGVEGVILTLIDPTTRHGYPYPTRGYVALDVIFLPTRTLAGRMYLYSAGCVHARHMFGDVRQEARKIAERLADKKQGIFVLKQRDRYRPEDREEEEESL